MVTDHEDVFVVLLMKEPVDHEDLVSVEVSLPILQSLLFLLYVYLGLALSPIHGIIRVLNLFGFPCAVGILLIHFINLSLSKFFGLISFALTLAYSFGVADYCKKRVVAQRGPELAVLLNLGLLGLSCNSFPNLKMSVLTRHSADVNLILDL